MSAPTSSKPKPSAPSVDQKAEKVRDQVLALDVKRVADWISTLVKTVKASRLYLPNNPQLVRFQADLESRTWSCLKEIGDIPLVVQQFDFLFENYSVYHNADRNDSLAFRFFADGVRSITIREGLEVGELRSLLEVLRRAIDGANGQDDVVTLLWERDFRHVEYVHLSLDDLTEGDPAASPTSRDEDGGTAAGESIPWPQSGFDEEPPPSEEFAAAGDATEEPADPTMAAERSDDWSAHIQRSRTWERPEGIQFELSDHERDELAHLIQMEEVRPLQREVLDIVAAILLHEGDGAGFMDSAVAFQRFIELAIEEGNVARARELLGRLKEIAAAKAGEGPEFAGIADQVIREIGRPSFLGQLAPTLNAHPDLDPEALTDFLVQLGSGATPAICDLLGQVNQVAHRRALCESLIASCRNDVEPLLARLGDSRWYVIRNVVYVLGRIAHQGVERALDRALHHEDVRVRKEAVRALGNIESPTARAYLVSAFRDADAGVRIQAAKTLAEKRDDRAAQNILGAIQAADFQRRDLQEKQAFYEALGRAGSDALVSKLEGLLVKGGLFARGDDDERFHAALALSWLGSAKAIAVLDREMKSKREPIRAAVEKALTAMRRAALAGKSAADRDDRGDVSRANAASDAAAPPPVGEDRVGSPVDGEAAEAVAEDADGDAIDVDTMNDRVGEAVVSGLVVGDASGEPAIDDPGESDAPVMPAPTTSEEPLVGAESDPPGGLPTLEEVEPLEVENLAETACAPAKPPAPVIHGEVSFDLYSEVAEEEVDWDAVDDEEHER